MIYRVNGNAFIEMAISVNDATARRLGLFKLECGERVIIISAARRKRFEQGIFQNSNINDCFQTIENQEKGYKKPNPLVKTRIEKTFPR